MAEQPLKKDDLETQVSELEQVSKTDVQQTQTDAETPIEQNQPVIVDKKPEPIKVPARPRAGIDKVVSVDVMSSEFEPGLPTATFSTLKSSAQESLKRKAAAEAPITYEEVVTKLKAGETVTLQTPKGPEEYGPEIVPLLEDSSFSEDLQYRVDLDQSLKSLTAQEVDIAYTDASATQIITDYLENPTEQNKAQIYAQGRINVNNLLKGVVNTGRTDIDVAIRQYFIDDYVTGGFFDSLETRLAEAGRGMVTIFPYAEMLASSLGRALGSSLRKGTPFIDEWAAGEELRTRTMQSRLEAIDTFLPGPSAAMHINNRIRFLAKQDFDNGVLTEEQYEDLIYEQVGEDGTRVERQFVDEQTAYDLIELSFTELSKIDQLGVLISENVLGGGIIGRTKSMQAGAELKSLAAIKKADKRFANVRLRDMPAFAASQGIELKIDNQLLDLGFFTKDTNKQMRQATLRRKEIDEELQLMELAGDGNSTTAKVLRSERDNLSRLQTRNAIRNKLTPYMNQVIGDEVLLAGAAFFGREFMTGMYGMEADTAELAGFAAGLIFDRPIRWVGKTGARITLGVAGFVGDRAIRYTGGPGAVIDAVYRKLTFADTTVEDYEKLIYMPANGGKRMSYEERQAVAYSFDMVDKAGPEEKRLLFQTLQGYNDLTDRIVAGFPPEHQAEARKLFTLSFGESTGLAPLVGSYQATISKFDIKNIRKNGLGDVTKAAEEVWNQAQASQIALDNFEKHVLSNAKAGSQDNIRLLISQTRKALVDAEAKISEDFLQLEEIVENVERVAGSDIFQDLPSDYMSQVIEARRSIDNIKGSMKGLGGKFQTQAASRQSIEASRSNWVEATTARANKVKGLRDNRALHRGALARMAEDFFEARAELMDELRSEAYAPFRQYMARTDIDHPPVDLTPFVEEMSRLAGESDIMNFFSAGGTFFSGALGRKARKSFENMVNRALDDLGPNSRSILEQELLNKDIATPEQIANLSTLDLGLLMHKFGAFNVFAKASLSEAEEMRKAFRDYGYKVTNPAVSSNYANAEQILDKAMMEADETGYNILFSSREKYRGTVGDANRKGLITYELYKSREGAERVGKAEFGFYKYYYKNTTPLSGFDDISDSLSKAMRGGQQRQKDLDNLQQAVTDASYALGTTMEMIDGKPNVVFDLSTEQGRKDFSMIQQIVEEAVYDGWGHRYLESMKTKSGFGGYAFEEMTNLDVLNSNMMVKVKTNKVDKLGNPVYEDMPLVDLKRMVAEEKDIVNEIQEGGRLEKQFEQFKVDFGTTVKKVKGRAKIEEVRQRRGMEQLKFLSGTVDPRQFYEAYIKGPESLDELEAVFMRTMERIGEDPAEAADMYRTAIQAMTYQGMLDVGAYTSQTSRTRGFNGELLTTRMLTDADSLLGDLANEDVKRNLLKIMDEEQLGYLTDIVDYTAAKAAIYVRAEGAVRGMSTNEILSRAYNISRQMVSPIYVASEMTVRLLQKNNSDAFLLAVQNKDASRIISKMIRFPKLVTPTELETLDTLLLEFAATDVIRQGQEQIVTEYLNMEIQEDEQTETNTSGQ